MGVGREILQALDRAFQLHQNADYQVSQVSTALPKNRSDSVLVFTRLDPRPPLSQQLREISREKSAEMNRLYSQMSQLGQHNAELVLKNINANTKMADLGARQRALEEELARVAGERDVQRAAAEEKAQEAEAQAAELQRLRTALEERAREVEAQSAELQHLSVTLEQ